MLSAAVISEITAYATLVTAIATGALAYLTYRLAWESRSLRKAGSEPRVVAYFEPHPDGHGGVNFVIANYGLGPAFEVDFKFHNDAKDFETHEVLLTNDSSRTPYTVVPQGQKLAALFGVGFVLFSGDKPLQPFKVSLQFKDIEGRLRSAETTLNIQQFTGLPGLANKPPILSITQSLEKIEGHLSKLGGSQGLLAQLVDLTKLSDSHRSVAKGNPPSKE